MTFALVFLYLLVGVGLATWALPGMITARCRDAAYPVPVQYAGVVACWPFVCVGAVWRVARGRAG